VFTQGHKWAAVTKVYGGFRPGHPSERLVSAVVLNGNTRDVLS